MLKSSLSKRPGCLYSFQVKGAYALAVDPGQEHGSQVEMLSRDKSTVYTSLAVLVMFILLMMGLGDCSNV